MNKINKRKTGAEYEDIAVKYLKEKGYTILQQNYRNKCGEIDIIAEYKQSIIFVEVKYRNNSVFGDPSEAVDFRKQKRIFQSAQIYCLQQRLFQNKPCRFDVIAIYGNQTIKHIENAFGGF